jgi:hypothetical protein
MKAENIDIKELLEKFSNLDDLERHLVEEGHEFKSPKELSEFLNELWFLANFNAAMKTLKEPIVDIKDLPYTEVVRNGIVFRIHGILHGDVDKPIGLRVKEFVSTRINGYKKLPEEDYLVEGGFSELFDVDKSREMDCVKKVCNRLDVKEQRVELQSIFTTIHYQLEKRYIKKTDNVFADRIIDIFEKMYFDPNYLPKGRKISSLLTKLPEPFNLQLKLRTGVKFSVYFSEEMTRFMLNYVQQNKKLKLLHAVVGYEHESEICYYLPRLTVI